MLRNAQDVQTEGVHLDITSPSCPLGFLHIFSHKGFFDGNVDMKSYSSLQVLLI